MLDEDAALRCSQAGLPRRDNVLVVVRAEPPPQVWRHAVAIGAAHVVSLPDGEAWLVRVVAEAVEAVAAGHRRGAAVAVVGGCGGAGASVLATALAVTAVRNGGRALLVDCDPLGGGLDLVLGAEQVAGLRWPDIDVGGGHVPPRRGTRRFRRPWSPEARRASWHCCPATDPHGAPPLPP